MRCPRCETLNPEGTLMCARCQTYLAATPAPPVAPPRAAAARVSPAPLPQRLLNEAEAGVFEPTRVHKTTSGVTSQAPSEPSPLKATPASHVPPDIQLSRLPAGPLKELFERGGVLDHKFALKRELGRGGMGFVFLGEDQSLGRDVALKVLPPHYNDDELVVRRFHREARAMASLDHPNIVTVYSIGASDDLHYFVMKHLQGETLAHELKRRELGQKPPFSAREVVRMVSQVCEGLTHAHERSILHRDIKPGNLMLGLDQRVTIMDFGIVKLLNTQDTLSMQTAHGKIFGTPEYMPPEQAMGKGEYGPASDIYALAIVTYELFCGTLPFKGATPIEIILQHIRSAPPALVGPLAGQLPGVERALAKAMAKEMSDRFESAVDFARALEEALPHSLPTSAGLSEGLSNAHPSSLQSSELPFTGFTDELETSDLQGQSDELAALLSLDLEEDEPNLEPLIEPSPPQSASAPPAPLPLEGPSTQLFTSWGSGEAPMILQPPPPTPVPAQPVVSQPVVSQPVPSQPVPSQPVPSQPVPSQPVPSQPVVQPFGHSNITPPPSPNLSSAPQAQAVHSGHLTPQAPSAAPSAALETPTRAMSRVEVEAASERKGHYRGLPIRRKGS